MSPFLGDSYRKARGKDHIRHCARQAVHRCLGMLLYTEPSPVRDTLAHRNTSVTAGSSYGSWGISGLPLFCGFMGSSILVNKKWGVKLDFLCSLKSNRKLPEVWDVFLR